MLRIIMPKSRLGFGPGFARDISTFSVGLVHEESDLEHGYYPFCYIFQKDLDKGLMR
jgi:hypothetical protein